MSLSLVNSIPGEVPAWCDLFNHPTFYKLHQTPSSVYLSFLYNEKLIGVTHFTKLENGIYRSPYRGTFGGINFREELDLQIKEECVKLLVDYLKTMSATGIEIITAPFAHDLHHATSLFNTFLIHSFQISNQEINHTLVVNELPLIEKMMRNNKKRLNKCLREGFEFTQVSSLEEINEVYQTIKENRESKGYEVSMRLDQILEMYDLFPDNLFFFKASQKGVCAASSICIKLNNKVLYVFYWGDKPGFEQHSPVVFLADGIYKFAAEKKFECMDAGTSSVNGKPNYGVAAFKENLGFTTSPKLTYTISYE